MRPQRFACWIFLAMTSLVACVKHEPSASVESVLRERFHSAYIAPYINGDVDGWMAVFAEDAVALHDGLPPLEGREAIRGFASAVATNFDIVRMEAKIDEVRRNGNWAWTRGRFEAEFRAMTPDAPPGVEGVRSGKFQLLWEKQSGGDWLVISDMGNSGPPTLPEVTADASLYYPCQSCHGVDGGGSEALEAPTIAGMDSDYLARQLRNFRDGVRGASLDDLPGRQMSLVAAVYTDDAQIDQLAAYVETMSPLPVQHVGSYDDASDAAEFEPCAVCHGIDGSGGATPGAPAINRLEDWYVRSQLQKFRSGVRGNNEDDVLGQQMRLASASLSDEQISKLTAHVSALSVRDN